MMNCSESRMNRWAGAIALVVLTTAASANAASVYGTGVAESMTGSRSVGNGLKVIADQKKNGKKGNWSSGTIEWTITQVIGGFEYTYKLTGFVGPPAVSHFAIDLSDDAIDDPNIVTSAEVDGQTIASGLIEFGDVEGITGGVKFDVGAGEDNPNVTYSFVSNRAPVWGDVSIEAGQGNGNGNSTHFLVQNTGFGDQTRSDPTAYIARPNGIAITGHSGAVVPLPAAVWAGLSLMGVLGGVKTLRHRMAR